ncbi:Predicted amidohydrolase [Thermomonospora echinospora]|uniref:Predicted amidohydrolase n=1 Tax=Thermomonospora echinospora TaxID=1992 RepID=A0A1H5U0P6_9ACTN|nr:nitrilase-related carbon-nitrogen hydrolase [Thermomonospora echinospora]SEF68645.1 Predicted amidohydrolase [Thermomonospora echinospora]
MSQDDVVEPVTAYRAVALQSTCRAINRAPSTAAARDMIRAAIDQVADQVEATQRFVGGLRLVVLPEYLLTGHPIGEPLPEWCERAALDPDGAEYARLAELSRDSGLFLCVNAYELDEHFPGLYFQASVVFDPRGKTVLRYRRLNSMFAVTPHDVLDRYLSIYGEDALFPVARTEIGNLAAIASEEILFPEVARCLAMRGAEVFLHGSSEVCSALLSPKNVAKLARAAENGAYVVSANTSGVYGMGLPAHSADGGSQIVDYRGNVLAKAGQGESMAANAELDLAALRRMRRTPEMMNLLPRQRFELYAPSYAGTSFYPPDTVRPGETERGHFLSTQRAVIDRLAADGLI